jgi:hypothetical protein
MAPQDGQRFTTFGAPVDSGQANIPVGGHFVSLSADG